MLEISAFRACRKDSFFRSSRVWATLSVALTALAFSPAAYSEYELYSAGNFTAKVSAALSGFAVTAKGGGAGGPGANDVLLYERTNEGEVTFEPQIDLTYDLDSGGTVYSRISYVAAASWTFGNESAPYGYVKDGDHNASREWTNLGYRNDLFDFSFGPQEFSVGDALLIGDAILDCGSSGGCGIDTGEFFLAPHRAFRESAILRVNQVPGVDDVRADIFWLEAGTDTYKGRGSQVWGANLEYTVPEEGLGFLTAGELALMYVAVTGVDQDRTVLNPPGGDNAGKLNGVALRAQSRDGRRFYSFRLDGLTFAALPNTKFYGEVILNDGDGQTNVQDKTTGAVMLNNVNYDDEYTYYAEIEHSLQDVPWSPVVGYRYFVATDGHDSLFYTFGRRGWGTWFQGEFRGEWLDNNTNLRSQFVKLVVSPPFSWLKAVHLLGFHHETFNPGNTLGNEVNLLAEWWNDSGFYVAGTFAHGNRAGTTDLNENYKDFNSLYIYLSQSF